MIGCTSGLARLRSLAACGRMIAGLPVSSVDATAHLDYHQSRQGGYMVHLKLSLYLPSMDGLLYGAIERRTDQD
jgi:hypothetical protein